MLMEIQHMALVITCGQTDMEKLMQRFFKQGALLQSGWCNQQVQKRVVCCMAHSSLY